MKYFCNFFICSIVLVLGYGVWDTRKSEERAATNNSTPSSLIQTDDTTTCYWCLEPIKKAALICKHCGKAPDNWSEPEPQVEKENTSKPAAPKRKKKTGLDEPQKPQGPRGLVFNIKSKLDFTAVDAAGGLRPRTVNAMIREFGEPDKYLAMSGGGLMVWARHTFVDQETGKQYRNLSIPLNKSDTHASSIGMALLN